MSTSVDSEKYLTYEEAAYVLCMSAQGLRNRWSKGEPMPPSIRVGRRRLFPESELHKWLAEHVNRGGENVD